MKKKILIMYATFGDGHKKAAEYVASVFSELKYDVKVMNINDHANWLGKASTKLFDFNVRNGSGTIFSMIYKFFDNRISSSPYRGITLNIYKKKNIYRDILKFEPDLIISTHFFCNAFVTELIKKRRVNPKVMTVITDFTSHELWTKNHEYTDVYIADNDLVKNMLIKRGISERKIYVYGIPFIKDFSNLDENEVIYEKYGIDKSKGYILFLGGSYGSMSSFKFFKKIVNKYFDKEVIVISGRNEKLRDKFTEYKNKAHRRDIKVLGFTYDMLNLMKAADFVITKPGGLVSIECLELKKPMILFPGAGGPEIQNAKYLVKKGVALYSGFAFKLMNRIKKMSNFYIKKRFIKNLEKIESNNSVINIYKLASKMLNQK